jgi:uncharacterized membrane protein YozB (DUF420 family)
MWLRAAAVWFAILGVAFINGGVRVALLIPRLGDLPAHAISSISLSVAILAAAWLSIGWIGVSRAAAAWRVGLLWVGMTLAFEFLAGHYIFGSSWARLLEDYNIFEGRIWLLVVATTLLAPLLAFRWRR